MTVYACVEAINANTAARVARSATIDVHMVTVNAKKAAAIAREETRHAGSVTRNAGGVARWANRVRANARSVTTGAYGETSADDAPSYGVGVAPDGSNASLFAFSEAALPRSAFPGTAGVPAGMSGAIGGTPALVAVSARKAGPSAQCLQDAGETPAVPGKSGASAAAPPVDFPGPPADFRAANRFLATQIDFYGVEFFPKALKIDLSP
ncbi:MAG: hypothetical protein ACJ76J_08025 [Thermoanaerobaculia bacterium]